MYAKTSSMITGVKAEVFIIHREEQLNFSISVFGRNSFMSDSTGFDVFDYINRYWQSLPESSQDSIFNIYKEVQVGFDTIYNKNELTVYLCDCVKRLLEFHSLEAMSNWIQYKSDIILPSTTLIPVVFVGSIDNNTTRDKTYLQSDYLGLLALSLSLRTLVPIWGEYIFINRNDTGTTFKEFYSFQLLKESDLIESPPMLKLKTYIDKTANTDVMNADNILKSINSDDIGYWLLTLVVVRKLCIGDIRGIDPTNTLITYIYKYVIQRVQNGDNNFENKVREPSPPGDGGDEDSKISVLERYAIKTDIPPGILVELEHCLKDTKNIARRLSANINEDILERSLQTSQHLLQERLLAPQMLMLRWIFKPIISPQGLLYLPKPTIVKALGIAEAVLWARGYKYLAILITSYSMTSDDDLIISPLDSKMRVPTEMTDELARIYPFTREVGSKNNIKSINIAGKAISTLADNLTAYNWKPTAHEDMLIEVFNSDIRRCVIKPDIKIELTKLVIELGSRRWI